MYKWRQELKLWYNSDNLYGELIEKVKKQQTCAQIESMNDQNFYLWLYQTWK